MRRDAILFFSYRTQVITQLIGTVFNLALFYFLSRLVTGRAFTSPAEYFAFVVVGLVIVQVLVTSIGLAPATVRQELVAGTLERLLVSPFGLVNGLIAMLVFPLLESLIAGMLMLVVAAVVFGLPLNGSAPLAVPVAILGALAFLPFSVFLMAIVLNVKQVAGGAQFIAAIVGLIGGLYFPATLLPGWLSWTTNIQPFSPAAELLRHVLSGAYLPHSALIDVMKLLGFAVVLLPLSVAALRLSVRVGMRRATIIEY